MTNNTATLICADGNPVTIVNVPAWVLGYARHKAGGGRLSLAEWLGANDPKTLAEVGHILADDAWPPEFAERSVRP